MAAKGAVWHVYVIFIVIQMLTVAPCCCLEVEKLARTLFLWKIEVHEQKEKVYEMRRWNEALVTNMLPEHVARHFLGSKKRDEVRPLFQLSCPPAAAAISRKMRSHT